MQILIAYINKSLKLLTFSQLKSPQINSVLLQDSHSLKVCTVPGVALCCEGLWEQEKHRLVDGVKQSTLDKRHISYGSSRSCFQFAPGGVSFFTSSDWKWWPLSFAETTNKALVLTTWFFSLFYSFTD